MRRYAAHGMVIVLCLMGIVVRLAAQQALHMPQRYVLDDTGYLLFDGEPGDAREYEGRAWHLVKGGNFWAIPSGDGNSPPGYSLLIAACYMVTGRSVGALLALNAMLGGLSVLAAARVGRRVFSRGAGVVAAAGVAFDPLLVYWSGHVLSETLSVFLMLVSLGLVLSLMRPEASWRRSALAGTCLAMLAMVRYIFFVLPFVVLAWGLVNRNHRRKLVPRSILALACCGGILAATMAVEHARRPPGVRSQWELLVTPGNLQRGAYVDIAVREAARARGGGLTDEEVLRIEEEATVTAREAPLLLLMARTWTSRLGALYQVTPSRAGLAESVAYAGSTVLLYVLALTGIGCAWRVPPTKRRALFLLLGIIVATTAVHCALVSMPRYRIPLHPLLWLLAGHGTVTAWTRLRRGSAVDRSR